MEEKLLAVVGPTATGKTALAVCLARRLGGEVVSMDSMQLYRGMRIGTAAPNEEEMGGVPHHMIGILDPNEPFSCADYAVRAGEIIARIRARGAWPILCGGTGLYLDSLTRRSSFSSPEGNEALRAELHRYAAAQGADALHARLAAVDPEAAAAIHPNNVRRVVRALEIYETSGITKTEWDRRCRAETGAVPIVSLDYLHRETLYARIDARVRRMMEEGLVEEARALYDRGYLSGDTVASQAIGYKELVPYFTGACTPEEAEAAICLATRRYAKRQRTWFSRYADAIRLFPDAEDPPLDAQRLADAAIEALRARRFLP